MTFRFYELTQTKRELRKVNYELGLIRKYNEQHNKHYAALTKQQSGINERLEWTTLQARKSHLEARTKKLINSLKFNRFNHLVSPIFKGAN